MARISDDFTIFGDKITCEHLRMLRCLHRGTSRTISGMMGRMGANKRRVEKSLSYLKNLEIVHSSNRGFRITPKGVRVVMALDFIQIEGE